MLGGGTRDLEQLVVLDQRSREHQMTGDRDDVVRAHRGDEARGGEMEMGGSARVDLLEQRLADQSVRERELAVRDPEQPGPSRLVGAGLGGGERLPADRRRVGQREGLPEHRTRHEQRTALRRQRDEPLVDDAPELGRQGARDGSEVVDEAREQRGEQRVPTARARDLVERVLARAGRQRPDERRRLVGAEPAQLEPLDGDAATETVQQRQRPAGAVAVVVTRRHTPAAGAATVAR